MLGMTAFLLTGVETLLCNYLKKNKQSSWTMLRWSSICGPITQITWLQLPAADQPHLLKLTYWLMFPPSLHHGGFSATAVSVDVSPSSGRSCASRTSSRRSRWWRASIPTMAPCCREPRWHPSTRESCSSAQSSTELSTVSYSLSRG